MASFAPVFKDDRDRLIVLLETIASIFFLFVPSIVVILACKDYVSEESYKLSKAIFNLELLFFLIGLLFMVPVVGWLFGVIVGPIMFIYNVIVMLAALFAVTQNREVKIPTPFQFL